MMENHIPTKPEREKPSQRAEPDEATPTLDAAMRFAGRGFSVIPVVARGKRPAGSWKAYQSERASEGDLETWFGKGRCHNIGIVTGAISGLSVVDADSEKDVAWAEANLPPTPTVETARGRHYYFRYRPGIGNAVRVGGRELDIRGEGGFVVAVPSKHPTGASYTWVEGRSLEDLPLADFPDVLMPSEKNKPVDKPAQRPQTPLTGTGGKYGQAALADELDTLARSSEGKRNDQLNRAAFSLGQLVAGGEIDQDQVETALLSTAESIGLTRTEVRATIRSGMDAGALEPRMAPNAAVGHGANVVQSIVGSVPTDGWRIEAYSLDSEPDLSHDALALELSQAGWGRDARYVNLWGRWLFWDGISWQMDEQLRHMSGVRDFLRAKAVALMEWAEKKGAQENDGTKRDALLKWARNQAKTLRQAHLRANIENTARSNRDLVATVEQFDADVLLLGTPDGTVDLRTGELRTARREDFITKRTVTAPARESTPRHLWEAFLDRIFDGDVELIRFMQRLAGYALTGETCEHCLVFCYGTGANGKSVFLNTLFAILNDYATRAPSETFLDSIHTHHPTDRAGLCGARLVIGSELPPGRAWDESAIKDLTGGDPITARFMRQDFFTFNPQFTLVIAGNHQPSLRAVDEGLRRRIVLVPFSVTIPPEERDPILFEKLKAEWPAILRWAIEGAVEWKRTGLKAPERVIADSKDYIDSEDVLGEFIEDCLVGAPDGFATTRDLYAAFNVWCKEHGMHTPGTQNALTRALKERGLPFSRRDQGNGLLGYKIREDVAGYGYRSIKK